MRSDRGQEYLFMLALSEFEMKSILNFPRTLLSKKKKKVPTYPLYNFIREILLSIFKITLLISVNMWQILIESFTHAKLYRILGLLCI